MSRHLVTNNSQDSNANHLNASITLIEPLSAKGASLEDYGYVGVLISTPKKAKELRAFLRLDGTATPTERLLFRKVEKAFDARNTRLAL